MSSLCLVVSLLLAGSALAADCFGKIEFQDTEYGHNERSDWSVWRKPITADQAAYIKQASVAYLVVPADMQRVDSAWREASAAGIRWRDIQVLPLRPIQRRHPGEKAYKYDLQLVGYKGPETVHEVVLLVSPAGHMFPNMVPHKRRSLVTEPIVEVVPPRRSPDQTWDVRLVITQHWPLAKPNARWEKFWRDSGKPEGFNNFQNDWRVALCTAAK